MGLQLDYTILHFFLYPFLFMIVLMHLKRETFYTFYIKISITQDMIKSLVTMKNKENCWQKVNL